MPPIPSCASWAFTSPASISMPRTASHGVGTCRRRSAKKSCRRDETAATPEAGALHSLRTEKRGEKREAVRVQRGEAAAVFLFGQIDDAGGVEFIEDAQQRAHRNAGAFAELGE